jgi:hypothetical protein
VAREPEAGQRGRVMLGNRGRREKKGGEGKRKEKEKGGKEKKRGGKEKRRRKKGKWGKRKRKRRNGGGKKKKERKGEKGVTRAGNIRGGDRDWSATRARRSHAVRGEKGGRDSGRIRVSVRGSGELGLRQKVSEKDIFNV